MSIFEENTLCHWFDLHKFKSTQVGLHTALVLYVSSLLIAFHISTDFIFFYFNLLRNQRRKRKKKKNLRRRLQSDLRRRLKLDLRRTQKSSLRPVKSRTEASFMGKYWIALF